MNNVLTLTALGAALMLGVSARAASLVTNGGFEDLSNGPGQLGYNTEAADWTTTGYNFVFASGTADSTGSVGQYGGLSLWGPNDGSANGLPPSSPDGGNFVGADGDFDVGPISQVINGLTVGETYKVGFDYGYAQQQGYNGDTKQYWQVSLGGDSKNLPTYDLPSRGFSGWSFANVVFTATSTTETLSFIAHGNLPIPPFALLDGVSLNEVPEPATWSMMILGVAGIGAFARRRRATMTVA